VLLADLNDFDGGAAHHATIDAMSLPYIQEKVSVIVWPTTTWSFRGKWLRCDTDQCMRLSEGEKRKSHDEERHRARNCDGVGAAL